MQTLQTGSKHFHNLPLNPSPAKSMKISQIRLSFVNVPKPNNVLMPEDQVLLQDRCRCLKATEGRSWRTLGRILWHLQLLLVLPLVLEGMVPHKRVEDYQPSGNPHTHRSLSPDQVILSVQNRDLLHKAHPVLKVLVLNSSNDLSRTLLDTLWLILDQVQVLLLDLHTPVQEDQHPIDNRPDNNNLLAGLRVLPRPRRRNRSKGHKHSQKWELQARPPRRMTV